MAHNGQIVNAIRLRNEMEDAGSIFQGTSDSEIILHLIRRQPGSHCWRRSRRRHGSWTARLPFWS